MAEGGVGCRVVSIGVNGGCLVVVVVVVLVGWRYGFRIIVRGMLICVTI